MKQLEVLVESNGVRFGVIYNTAFTTTDHQYFSRTSSYLRLYSNLRTYPTDYVLEDWFALPAQLTPYDRPYTGLYGADNIFKTPRHTCNGVPGIMC